LTTEKNALASRAILMAMRIRWWYGAKRIAQSSRGLGLAQDCLGMEWEKSGHEIYAERNGIECTCFCESKSELLECGHLEDKDSHMTNNLDEYGVINLQLVQEILDLTCIMGELPVVYEPNKRKLSLSKTLGKLFSVCCQDPERRWHA
jgi:hypothetical protein